jgi:hypothetical protein
MDFHLRDERTFQLAGNGIADADADAGIGAGACVGDDGGTDAADTGALAIRGLLVESACASACLADMGTLISPL